MKIQRSSRIILSLAGIAVFFISALGSFESSWGIKITYENGSELYYKSPATEQEAKALGEYLSDAGWFDVGKPVKTVQLLKIAGVYQVRFPVKEGYDKDEDYLNTCKLMAQEISEGVFEGKTVEIHLCDNNLNTLVVVSNEDSSRSYSIEDEIIGSWEDEQILLEFDGDRSIRLISLNGKETIPGTYSFTGSGTVKIQTLDETIRIYDVQISSDTLFFKDEADITHKSLRIR